jgi:hypothetical protein
VRPSAFLQSSPGCGRIGSLQSVKGALRAVLAMLSLRPARGSGRPLDCPPAPVAAVKFLDAFFPGSRKPFPHVLGSTPEICYKSSVVN